MGKTDEFSDDAKRNGLIALLFGFLNLAAMICLIRFPIPYLFPLVFLWGIPFTVALGVEKNDLGSIGVVFKGDRVREYVQSTALGFLFLTLMLGLERYARISIAHENPEGVLLAPEVLLGELLI